MSRGLLTSITAICLFLISFHTPAHAGGWAAVTLDEWPSQVTPNQPFTISYGLRQHGVRLLTGQKGSVVFDDEQRPDAQSLQFDAQPAVAVGHYTATIVLPAAGTWRWRINAWGEHNMPPLTVRAAAAAAEHSTDPLQEATSGQALFVAKGCSTCHSHPAVAGSHSGPGPALPNHLLTADYLRRWLSDPKAVKPTTLMPNLDLKEKEVEALTAFLLVE
jgi:cytochrome c2